MAALVRYEDYTRRDVHDIFEPTTQFTQSAGTWGIAGIVQLADRPGDFVLFVTFGQRQGSHLFDEGITRSGVLSWQSQPQQGFQSRIVQKLIAHDDATNSIYLFLRTKEGKPYTYLGQLRYLTHDLSRERPVHFQWQILDWNISEASSERIELILAPDTATSEELVESKRSGLRQTEPPTPAVRDGVATPTFQSRRVPDRSTIEKENRRLGRAGELLVLNYERDRLRRMGCEELARQVRHISDIEGDGAGFDIQSFEASGASKYIEVKTTKGSAETPFYLSSNELAFAKSKGSRFCIYRVYEYSENPPTGSFYVTSGDPSVAFQLTAVQFRAVR